MNDPMNEGFDREAAEALDRLAREEGPGRDFEARLASSAADAALGAWLDALGRCEARSAPAGFEARILDAVAGELSPAPIQMPRRGAAGMARWAGAAAAVLSVAAGAWWIGRPSGSAPATLAAESTLADDFGLLLELYETPSWSVDVVEWRSDADSVAEALESPWAEYESLSESLTDGAI